MKKRCNNPRSISYPYYGARGVRVHPAWDSSFETFLREVGERPSLDYSIDRIDPTGDYVPGNVRWATKQEQSQNRRPPKRIQRECGHCGKSFTVQRYIVARGEGLFCSHACGCIARRNRVDLTCPTCGKTFQMTRSSFLLTTRHYCSMRCRGLSPQGARHIESIAAGRRAKRAAVLNATEV